MSPTAPPTLTSPMNPADPAGAAPTTGVLGDGTTARSRTRARWRRHRGPLIVAALVVAVAVGSALLPARTSQVALAPDNPGAGGSRALAEVLRRQGVEIRYVRTSGEAMAAAGDGTTLLVTTTHLLLEEQVAALAESPADLVLLDPDWTVLQEVTDGALDTSYGATPGLRPAACDDPDAQAAETVTTTPQSYRALEPGAVLCFGPGEGVEEGAYASLEVGGRRVVVLGDAGWLTNGRVDEDGNAALALRSLGHHGTLVWYVPSLGDTGEPADVPEGALTPPWSGPLTLLAVVVLALLAVWRGRALGRVVTEPLPVTVRAAETTVGRGRLYRRARARGHAAAALRAGTARRTAARLGLPRSAGALDVIDALARATGRSTTQVADLLYGPPPPDDAALVALARGLDELESEVHRT